MMFVFDEAAFRAPARVAVWMIALRPRLLSLCAGIRRISDLMMPWLAAAALVLGYLLMASWMDQDELASDLRAAHAGVASLNASNRSLRETIAELEERHPGSVFYVLEGKSADDVKAKLARAAMQLATEHYRLQQATKEPQQ